METQPKPKLAQLNQDTKTIRILQWNCNSLLSRKTELLNFAFSNQPDIIAVQEARFNKNGPTHLPGYKFPPVYINKGAVATYIKEDITATEFKTINDKFINTVGTAITLQNGTKLKITNFYTNKTDNYRFIQQEQLNSLFRDTDIILGDFNAHSPLWEHDLTYTDKGGSMIEEAMDNTKKVLINNGDPTHYICRGKTDKENTLDLTISNPELASKMNWQVSINSLGSDHLPITIDIEHCPEQPETDELKRINTTNTNWDIFHSLTNHTQIWEADDSLDTKTQKLTDIIVEAIKTSTPQNTGGKYIKAGKKWWNEDCHKKIATRNRAYKIWRKHKTIENRQAFTKAKTEAKVAVEQAKKKEWHTFTETLNTHSGISKTWQVIKRMNNGPRTHMPTLQTTDRLYETDKEKAELLADTFQKFSSDENIDPEFREIKNRTVHQPADPETPTPKDPEKLLKNISMLEQALATKGKVSNSAPGPDLITYEMINKCHPNMKKMINELFNDLLKAGYYPKAWRSATVVPIHKTGKPSKSPDSYRPIALTSQLGKTFEIILKKRLTHFCEKRNIIPPQQSGFRQKRSTLDHLTTLAQLIQNHHSQRNRDLIGIFLDIQKAYDQLWRDGLLTKLRKYQVPTTFYKVIESFLTDRKMKVKVANEYSNEKVLQNGVPQGSVISPLLFNIMIADLGEKVKTCSLMQFADDTSLLGKVYPRQIKGRWHFPGIDKMQRDLSSLEQWFKLNGFQLSVMKTQAIWFRSNRLKKCPPKEALPKLRLGNMDIEYSPQVKFLGVTFSSNNSYVAYIENLVAQATKGLNLMRSLCGTSWGSQLPSMMNIYHAHVMSRMLYAAPILVHVPPGLINKLRIVQTKALRIALGVSSTTPVLSTLAETGQLPIQDIIKTRAASYYFKVKAYEGEHPTTQILDDESMKRPPVITQTTKDILSTGKLSNLLNGPQITTPRKPPWTHICPKIDLTLTQHDKHSDPLKMKTEFNLLKDSSYRQHRIIFTDGSKIPETGETGAGIYFPKFRNISVTLSHHLSIFTAELTAIKLAITAIQVAEAQNPTTQKYLIATDSLSSLQALQNQSSQRQDLVYSILLSLTECFKKGLQIDLLWVPAHIGIAGNEKADTLAKVASTGENTTCLKFCQTKIPVPISPAEKIVAIKMAVREQWKVTYHKEVRGTRKLLSSTPSNKPVQIPGTRKEQALLARMRLGGERNLHKQNNTICQCGQNTVNTYHLLLECDLNHNHRTELLNALMAENLTLTLENALNPPPNIWNFILRKVTQIITAHPQGTYL